MNSKSVRLEHGKLQKVLQKYIKDEDVMLAILSEYVVIAAPVQFKQYSRACRLLESFIKQKKICYLSGLKDVIQARLNRDLVVG